MLKRMHGQSFNWLSWRGGTLTEYLNIQSREKVILANSHIIRKYAIGYCEGEHLLCRPKINSTAVMFLKDGIDFWTHLTNKEFNIIFKIKKSGVRRKPYPNEFGAVGGQGGI